MFNSCTEEFKKNAVAVVKTGYGVANLAKRLHVPPSSIVSVFTLRDYAYINHYTFLSWYSTASIEI